MKGNLVLTCLFSILIRWSVSLFPYSGQEKPPMFGDYEAQRHWMEVTSNLPLEDWYVNTTENNLMYWGLDYPPLTAYHSYLCGMVANYINPDYVKLQTSHGYESYKHKLFMRSTVLVGDFLFYIPFVCWYFHGLYRNSLKRRRTGISLQECISLSLVGDSSLNVAIMLLYPGMILIDYGHFQYNSISLGFTVAAVASLQDNLYLLASFFFCLALNYKQMELYHAMPFFCYLLGLCFHDKSKIEGVLRLCNIGVVVVGCFAIIWLPFLADSKIFFHVLHRLFPFARGIFEDKVSNFWCSISVFVKLKNLYTVSFLTKICLVTTFMCIIPSSVNLFLRPTFHRFQLALVNSALVFFLFSFQVHEKSILLVAIPVCLLFPYYPFPCFWFLLISTFSMLPLLIKDGLIIPYISLMILYFVLVCDTVGIYGVESEKKRKVIYSAIKSSKTQGEGKNMLSNVLTREIMKILFLCSLLGCAALTVGSLTVPPPSTYPDIFPFMVSLYSCGHFLLFLFYFYRLQFICKEGW